MITTRVLTPGSGADWTWTMHDGPLNMDTPGISIRRWAFFSLGGRGSQFSETKLDTGHEGYRSGLEVIVPDLGHIGQSVIVADLNKGRPSP